MRKVICIMLLLFLGLGIVIQLVGLEKVLAGEKVRNAVEWVNTLGRKADDPPYLTMNYRLRTLYFSWTTSVNKQPVVFFGDSITFGADWHKLFPEVAVVNRGISGDTTLGLLNRQDEVIAMQPRQIFLMIGTNDLCFNRPIEKIVENYDRILLRFRKESPATAVFVQSVLPFNAQLYPSNGLRKNKNIEQLNRHLEPLAHKHGYVFLNLNAAFTAADGQLLPQYTYDGLHLNETAYWVWQKQIERYVGKI